MNAGTRKYIAILIIFVFGLGLAMLEKVWLPLHLYYYTVF